MPWLSETWIWSIFGLGKYNTRTRVSFQNDTIVFQIRTVSEDFYCQIVKVPKPLRIGGLTYGFPKHSPYLPIFDFYIKELRDYGELPRYINKYLSTRPVQCETQGATKPIGKWLMHK